MATWSQNSTEWFVGHALLPGGHAVATAVGPVQIEDHVEPGGVRPLDLLIDGLGVSVG